MTSGTLKHLEFLQSAARPLLLTLIEAARIWTVICLTKRLGRPTKRNILLPLFWGVLIKDGKQEKGTVSADTKLVARMVAIHCHKSLFTKSKGFRN